MKVIRLVFWLAAASLAFSIALVMFQDRLLYFPAKANIAELTSGPLRAWPSAEDFRGLVAEPEGEAHATAIVFHGNAGHVGHRGWYAAALAPLGLRVILAEYPGYGPREGKLGEASLVADAAETIASVRRSYGAPLIVVGESLGAGVAAAAVERETDKVAGVLLITPWDNLTNVASHRYPWLPVSWLLQGRYDSVGHLARFAGPKLVAAAAQDHIVPARFGRALYEALPEPKRLAVIEKAGHNDWPLNVDRDWWRRAIEYLLAGPEVR